MKSTKKSRIVKHKTSVVGGSRTSHEPAETSTTAIVDDQEAHDDNQCHANEYRPIVEVLAEAKFSHDFVEAAANAQLVQFGHHRGWQVEAAAAARWGRRARWRPLWWECYPEIGTVMYQWRRLVVGMWEVVIV